MSTVVKQPQNAGKVKRIPILTKECPHGVLIGGSGLKCTYGCKVIKRKHRTRWTKNSLDRRTLDAQGLCSWVLKEPAGFHKGAKLSGCKGISEATRRLIRKAKDADWSKLINMSPATGRKGEKA